MNADLGLTLFGWVAGIAAMLGSGALMTAWIAGLLDRIEPRGPTATNPKDLSQ